jgi:hypothetical protein
MAKRVRKADTHPPLGLFAVSSLCTLVTLYFLISSGLAGNGDLNFAGAITGMIIGGVVMGLFRQSINKRTSAGNFADWSISSVKLGTVVASTGWLLGLANLILFAQEFSRSL